MVRGALPVTPDRASLRFSDRAVNMSSFRQARNTQFFTRSGSPAVRTTSFEQQRQMIQQASGRFGGNAAVSGNGFSRGAAAVPAQHGWSRFGEPAGSTSNGRSGSNAPAGPTGGGWSRYNGTPGGTGADASGRSSGSAVRISPPIVRDRSTQSYSAPSYSAPRSYGGSSAGNQYGGRAQSYSAPAPRAYNAPAPRSEKQSAPKSSAPKNAPKGGGGGGGGHSGGGSHHR